jgi:minor histocompatibility antigen H13
VATIYIGAHRGLTTKNRQQISLKEGALAPFFASASLFGLYLLIKYVPDFSIQTFIDVYFWLLGSFAIGGAVTPLMRSLGGPLGQKSVVVNPPEGLLLDDEGKSITRLELAPTDFAAVAIAVGLATAELMSHHTNFTLNNMVRSVGGVVYSKSTRMLAA